VTSSTGLNIEEGCQITLEAYAEYLVIIGETLKSVIQMAGRLISKKNIVETK